MATPVAISTKKNIDDKAPETPEVINKLAAASWSESKSETPSQIADPANNKPVARPTYFTDN